MLSVNIVKSISKTTNKKNNKLILSKNSIKLSTSNLNGKRIINVSQINKIIPNNKRMFTTKTHHHTETTKAVSALPPLSYSPKNKQEDNDRIMFEASASCKTVRDLLRFATTQLRNHELTFGHSTNDPNEDAFLLVLSSLNLPCFGETNQFLDAAVTPQEQQTVLHNLKTRIDKKMPVSYITNTAVLGGFEFFVDQRTIIPRSFIAEIFTEEEFLKQTFRDPGWVRTVCDMCTGSACLSIIMATAFPQATIDAIDLSKDALEVAKINVERYNFKDRIKLIHSNLFANVPATKYDLIVSNPPYVEEKAIKELPEESKYEPLEALQAGENGLKYIEEILLTAGDYLSSTGMLMIETGGKREALEKRFPMVRFTWAPTSIGENDVCLVLKEDLDEIKNNPNGTVPKQSLSLDAQAKKQKRGGIPRSLRGLAKFEKEIKKTGKKLGKGGKFDDMEDEEDMPEAFKKMPKGSKNDPEQMLQFLEKAAKEEKARRAARKKSKESKSDFIERS